MDALVNNYTLTSLYISNNNIRKEGAKMIAYMITKNKTLTTLDLCTILNYLAWNDIRFEGGKSIIEATKVNQTLNSLSLSSLHNKFSGMLLKS